MAFQLNFLFKATKDWDFHEHGIVYFKIFFFISGFYDAIDIISCYWRKIRILHA